MQILKLAGTDQTFNLLVGRELQKDYDQEPQIVMTFPLLVGLDGKEKMSKSLGNYIGIDEAPEVMYEKAMKIPDDVLLDYFNLTTDLDLNEVKKLLEKDIVEAHKVYAREIIRLYHGKDAIESAEERYKSVASGSAPENLREVKIEEKEIALTELLLKVGFASSKGDAKRMIQGKGVKLNGETAIDIGVTVKINEPVILQFGKNKFVKVTA